MKCRHFAFRSLLVPAAFALLCPAMVFAQPAPILETRAAPWQQVSATRVFSVFPEREEYSTLDRVGRLVLAVETGGGGVKLSDLAVEWRLARGAETIAEQRTPISEGLIDVSLDLRPLTPGRYDLAARLMKGAEVLVEKSAFFRLSEEPLPPQRGRVPVILPRGVPVAGWPIQFGVPFPKGALWSERNIRMVRADGTPVPCGVTVRSRWGHRPESSVRWLGVDFQPEAAGAWWPDRREVKYYLEFGPEVAPAAAPRPKAVETPDGIEVDAGALRFLVRRQGFNLLDNVRLNGAPVLTSTPRHGLYLVDHEGATYRAANDRAVALCIEEQTDLRVVLRAEGWYVKDGSAGETLSHSLPTDKLCKFVTRIEAHAGKPWVRVLTTWILTYDSFTVRLRDVGFSLPAPGVSRAAFGVEGAPPIVQPVGPDGLYLIQHLHNAFAVENGQGQPLARGAHSAGWVAADTALGWLTLGHRETWQRFPKELEVLPDELRLHIWPAHGRLHPEINDTARDQLHRLWFAHQGRELTLTCPWRYYFAAAEYYDDPSTSSYKAAGHAIAAVHAAAMGIGVTSDCLIQFAPAGAEEREARVAAAFQSYPHALAAPQWTCDSLALGWQHPYDPERFAGAEEIISAGMRAYWATQDAGGIYGMWLYRPWHHSAYFGNGVWDLYRLYNGSHHYEAVMPWLFYARSGDPFYLTQGMANLRELTDIQITHYSDPNYRHKDYVSHQRRLVGSMQHDDCIAPWGGDHAILGHVTCYNGPIMAHYLTGDLRAREVLVEEWQRTLVADRANREYVTADLSPTVFIQNPRNNSSSIGEILDLYQLTYDARLLALLAPRLDIYLSPKCMGADWGYPLHNLLLFHGSSVARKALLDGVKEFAATGGKTISPENPWRPLHSLIESFALAGILQPEASYALDAFHANDLNYWRHWVWRVGDLEPRIPLCPFPDTAIYLPRAMGALARSVHRDTALAFGDFQEMPRITGRPLRCIVREDADREFAVHLVGKVKQPFPLQVFGPDNTLLLERQVPAGWQSPFTVTVPKDGKTGQYVLFIGAGQPDVLFAPVTELPEVYVTAYWTGNNNGQRFFTRPTGGTPEIIQVQPHRGGGAILSADLSRTLVSTDSGEIIKAEIGPEGAWVYNKTCYIGSPTPLILSRGPARWFAPDADKLDLQMKK